MLYDVFSNNYFHKSLVKITDILSQLLKPDQFQLSMMRSWMSPKTFFVLVLSVFIQQSITKNTRQAGVTPIQMPGGNKQLVDRINDFAFTIENKTRGLFDFDKELNMTEQAIFNDRRKNSYMIQKEKEKLSIIPMNPVEINPERDNKENIEEDSLKYDDDYGDYDDDNDNDDDDEEDRQNLVEPIQVIHVQ